MSGGIKLKALVKTAKGVGNVEIKNIPEPVPGPGQVKILVKAAGICGTDLHIYNDEYPSIPPVVLGHEIAGEIVECGKGVCACEVGKRVTARTFMITCGRCQYCNTGKDNLCPERLSIGSGVNGGFARYVIVPEKNIFYLPQNISYAAGALTEPLACCVHAVLEVAHVSVGERVLIVGPGPIGILCSQLVKASGGYVVVIGTASDKQRLQLAKDLGADEVIITPQANSLIEREKNLAFDVVFECSGTEEGVNIGLKLLRKGGRYTQIGLSGKLIKFPIDQAVYKEVKFFGSFSHTWSAWDAAIRLLSRGLVQTEPLVSHKLPLSCWKEAFKMFEEKKCIKIILIPDD
jgi:L-iditol 2-dehydrogenase